MSLDKKEQALSYLRRLEKGFFGRWIMNNKVSLLLIVLLFGYGLFSIISIPKESAPDVKFGIVSIVAPYPGANPVDIDDTITTKLYDAIKDLDGIDSINATSSLGVGALTVTLENGIDVRDFITDARNKVDSVSLPSDALTPTLTEISTSNEILFQMMIYGPKDQFSMNHLRSLALQFKDDVSGKASITDVGVDGSIGGGSGGGGGGGSTSSDFDVQVILDAQKIEGYGLTVGQILGQIRAYNQNLPLGNYRLGDLRYDYRIDNELRSLGDLQTLPILVGNNYVSLGELASIERVYKSKKIVYGGVYESINNHAIELTIFKAPGGNIFADASSAKAVIESTLEGMTYSGLSYQYTRDLAETIIKDYSSLGKNALTSLALVFLVMLLFLGVRQSLIATFVMPLSYLIVFIVLNSLGRTMNFMVNFSLIVAFGLGVDMIIVYVEAAWTNLKLGYDPRTAMLIAMQTYSKPNIISALTNLVVFIPLLILPGIIGKFLSNIPITLFASLGATLFLALTLNGPIFVWFNKNLDHYVDPGEDDESMKVLTEDQKELLSIQREGKTVASDGDESRVDKQIFRIQRWYAHLLDIILSSGLYRKLVVYGSIGITILSFVILAPMIGFKLFPSGDNPSIDFTITAQQGTDTTAMIVQAEGLDAIVAALPEIKNYTINTFNNKIDLALTLVDKEDRQRDSFEIQAAVEEQLTYLSQRGYTVESAVQAGGPPTGKAVGIDLVAADKSQINQLRQVAQEFQDYLSSVEGTTNVSSSSTDSPGQFSLSFDKVQLAQLGLTPSDIQNEIYGSINGIKAGTIMVDKTQRDIILKLSTFTDEVSPSQLKNLVITTRSGKIPLHQIVTLSTDPALTSVVRKDGDIVITVESDLEQGLQPTKIQADLIAFANRYNFPDGLSYKAGGENAANADLIQSAGLGFVIAIFLTFVLLVYQFNSFSKPAIILYSIVVAFLGVNIGLFVTGNPYSMAFAIGFIALTGIVVNTAIFLVDRIYENIKAGLGMKEAILEAGQTRFRPILITTATTILGISSLVRQDEFYAGLGYTIIFGLLFSTVITLIGVPVLYYSIFRDKADGELSRRAKITNYIRHQVGLIKQLIDEKRGA